MARKLEGGIVPPEMGNLYLVNKKRFKKLFNNIGISNGLAWNTDETKLYWADTLAKKVYKFSYDSVNLEINADGNENNNKK